MLAADAARVTAARLSGLTLENRPLRLIVYPELYGVAGVPSVADLAVHSPLGWVTVLKPRGLGMGNVDGRWAVTLQVAAPRGRDLTPLARLVTRTLHHTARRPTAFQFQTDEASNPSAEVQAINLTFVATIRHEE